MSLGGGTGGEVEGEGVEAWPGRLRRSKSVAAGTRVSDALRSSGGARSASFGEDAALVAPQWRSQETPSPRFGHAHRASGNLLLSGPGRLHSPSRRARVQRAAGTATAESSRSRKSAKWKVAAERSLSSWAVTERPNGDQIPAGRHPRRKHSPCDRQGPTAIGVPRTGEYHPHGDSTRVRKPASLDLLRSKGCTG
jgi:hypothetical protein